MKVNLNQNIFKEYDIRGKYPSEINKKTAYVLAAAFVNCLKKNNPKIVVAKDLRQSSPSLAKSFIKGSNDAGADIIDIGIAATPMLYFAIHYLKASGGVMITASHNLSNYNGIKMIDGRGMPISGKELKRMISKKARKNKKGACEKIDISKIYLDAVLKDFAPGRKKEKILVNGKGVSKIFIPELIKRLHIAPSKNPHFYALFDSDADRLMIADKNKNKIRGDIVGMIIGDSIAEKKEKIVCDLRCSRAVLRYFKNKGVIVILSKVGHFNIKKLMREKDAVFGMELSGHYFFRKFNCHEAPFYALRTIIEKKLNINEPFPLLKKYFHSGEINIPAKSENFNKIAQRLKNDYRSGAQNLFDGLTVEFSNWWFNIRPSKTEPVMRLVVEANSQKILEKKKKELMEKII